MVMVDIPDGPTAAAAFVGAVLKPNGRATHWRDETPIWADDEEWNEAEIPERPWVARGYALRGHVTVVAGPPSGLKSSLMLAWAAAGALGREHGSFRPVEAVRVIVYNVEDDRIEQRRRLSAVLRQFEALPRDLRGRLLRTGPTGVGTLFARQEDGSLAATPALERLRELIREHRPAVLIADPLAELHTAEENDNTALRAVIAEFRALAAEFDMAIVLVHHVKKGPVAPGDPDAARGASAIIGAARIVLTVATMTEEDASGFGLPTSRQARSRYVRLDDAKQNYAPIGEAEWYEKALYTLDNGEVVAAALPWAPPDLWRAINTATANRILDRIEAGLGDGQRYSPAAQAKDRAAWQVVLDEVPTLTDEQARKVIKAWLDNHVIEAREYQDPDQRRTRKGLFINPAKRPG
jgi:hypothetical protein